MKKTYLTIALLFLFFGFSSPVMAQTTGENKTENNSCLVYFTGIGCPHCAEVGPFVFKELVKSHPELALIEYEIYQQAENAPLIYAYNSKYQSGLGIPLAILDKGQYFIGDNAVAEDLPEALENSVGNPCLLADGKAVHFKDIDLTSLPGRPKIWKGEKIMVSGTNKADGELLKKLLTVDFKELPAVLSGIKYQIIKPETVAISGGSVDFENAIKLGDGSKDDWMFQWNGPALAAQSGNTSDKSAETEAAFGDKVLKDAKERKEKLTLLSILSLAAVDAINPCALTVLTLMLISILTYDPKNRKNVILAGLAFSASVFVMYFFYGLVIIRFFQVVQALTSVRFWLYKSLGLMAVLLGALNIRDFIKYRPGRLGTEMPLFMRPRVKKIISGVTRPRGAFIVGIFVTLFLLPCTIGPYIICGGILCSMDLVKTIPWLLIYNLVFILPMVAITLIVYFGMNKVEDVAGWKDKNIRSLHLAAGVITLLLGLAMLLGWA